MRFLMRVFGEESAVGRFLNRLYIIIVSNLLFLLFSLPVITIGAAFSALNYTLMRFQRGDRHFKVAATFWKGFRESFKTALLCTAGLALLFFLQVLEITWCRQFRGPAAFFQYPLIGIMVLEGILAMYLFPGIAAFNGGIREQLRNAVYFAFSQPQWMLLCLLIHIIPVAVTYMFITLLPLWAFLWLMFGFAGITWLSSHIMLRQFMPFLPEVDLCGDIIPEDMADDPGILRGDSVDVLEEPDEKTLLEMMKYGL